MTPTTFKINSSLKALFSTGLFADVSFSFNQGILRVNVVENPIINRIAFEGNQRLDDETLGAELQLRPRVVYTRTKVQADVQRVLELYRRSGRFAATVEPKVIQLDQNRVDLAFEIDEGDATGIRKINFVGNKAFDDGELSDVIRTTESAWWKILTADDNYDPDRVTFDRELLRRFYLAAGYADFQVLSSVAELTPDRSDFFVTYTVSEGQRYQFGEINVVSQIDKIDPETLMPLIEIESGEWYNATLVDDAVDALADRVGDQGYAFIDIRPNVGATAKLVRLTLPSTLPKAQKSMSSASMLSATSEPLMKWSVASSVWSKAMPLAAPRCSAPDNALKT